MGDPDTIGKTGLFEIPYEVMLPRGVDNMLVPICVSMSHVAFCAFRTEPTYMMMGDAAGLAAVMAVLGKEAVRDLGSEVSRVVSSEPQRKG